ncbi:MDR3 protein, partial [Rhinoptilus africanus]|nr:MDR3 protein [Rhinoptilus africanus]
FGGNITFNNVVFNYPTRTEAKVLRGLNSSVEKGQTLALVGSSGCGRSTVLQLLEGFYDPLSGEMVSVPHQSVSCRETCSEMCFSAQPPCIGSSPTLAPVTGKGAAPDSSLIGNAAQTPHSSGLGTNPALHLFPLSRNTEHMGDRGNQLSVGQKQHVATAPALVRQP